MMTILQARLRFQAIALFPKTHKNTLIKGEYLKVAAGADRMFFGSVLNRVGSPPSCGHPLITRYSGGLEWGSG